MSKGRTTTTQEAIVPDYLQNLFQTYATRAQEASQIPFEAYGEPRVAGLSPAESQALLGAQSLYGSAFGFDPTAQLQQLAGQQLPTVRDVPSLLDIDIGAYETPYTQQVLEPALADIERRKELAQQKAQEAALGAGSFGVSRSAMLETEATRPFVEEELGTIAGLRQAGFEQAQRAALSDIARQQQLAMFEPELQLRGQAQQAGLLSGLLGGQQQAISSLAGLGGLQRGLEQAQRDFAFQEFMRRQGYPMQQLGLLGSAVGTLPQSLIGQTREAQQRTGPLGILGGLAGLGSSLALGGINPFGFLGGGAATGAVPGVGATGAGAGLGGLPGGLF